jgi:hypothetical protein
MSHSYTCRVFRRRIHFLTDKVLPSPSAAHDSIIPLPRLRSTTLVCYFQSWGHLNCRMNALALSPVFEQVLGIARLRGLPAPPLQHSYVHGAEDGTTSIRFSPIRCQCQTASGLYTPPPTYSPDGTSPGALVLSRPLPNDPASMASPLTVMPASHTRFCSIVSTYASRRPFDAPILTYLVRSIYSVRTAISLQRIPLFSTPIPCVFANFWLSSLHPSHFCDAYYTIWVPCDVGSTSFA